MIASYSDYMVQIMRLIDGDDVSASEISTATLNQVIDMAQRRIYREVRSRYNERAFVGLTVTGNIATLPVDFERISVLFAANGKALRPATEEWLLDYLSCNPSGDCQFFAAAGGTLRFGPALADGTVVLGRYFYRLADLTPANFAANTLIAREADLFIYAALVEAIPFFAKAQAQGAMFMTKYAAIVDAVNLASANTATNAGRLSRGTSFGMIA